MDHLVQDTVLFICDEWKSAKGGLSSFNRWFSSSFANATSQRIKVYCYVLECDESDRKDATRKGVTLIAARPRLPLIDHKDWLKFVPPELPQPDVVIGHGRQFGPAAYFIKEATGCKWVQFVHAFLEDVGKYKIAETESITKDLVADNEKKHKQEIDLCKEADRVFAVGPRLQSKYQRCLPNVEVEVITPGILEGFLNNSPQCPVNSHALTKIFNSFVFGRGTYEDLALKGYDIIASAVRLLGWEFELTFVGSPQNKHSDIMRWLMEESGIGKDQLTVRGYCNQEELNEMLGQADLVVLPSRTEGFGLVPLEALSAGVPILVSRQSGIAKALEFVEGGDSVIVNGGSSEWAQKIQQLSKKTKEERRKFALHLRENYQKTYPWSAECKKFKKVIEKLVEGSHGGLNVASEKLSSQQGIDEKSDTSMARPVQDSSDYLNTLQETVNTGQKRSAASESSINQGDGKKAKLRNSQIQQNSEAGLHPESQS